MTRDRDIVRLPKPVGARRSAVAAGTVSTLGDGGLLPPQIPHICNLVANVAGNRSIPWMTSRRFKVDVRAAIWLNRLPDGNENAEVPCMPCRYRRIGLTALVALVSTACGSTEGTKESGQLVVTVSAEALGASGYAFPPAPGQELAFVDGWDVGFERIIVAVDNIRISEMPDRNPSDQGQMGVDVAVRRGPFVLDLKKPGNVEDKGQAGKVAIRLPIDDLKDRFDLEQRYAFSFDLVEVTSDAIFVNVEPDDPDVLDMVEAGERALFRGRANFEAQSCQSSSDVYDFSLLPTSVDFRFGLRGGVSYLNCQNPDNQGKAITGEESQRGIQMLPGRATMAQITIHTDHLFWSSVNHENLPMFNQFAANATHATDRDYVALDGLESVPLPGVTDKMGVALPWRSCVDKSMYVLPSQPATMTFDSGSLAMTNLREFVEFNAATLGHLNADGLCFVKKSK